MTSVRAVYRLLALAVHWLAGLMIVALLFPWLDRGRRERHLMRWAGRLLAIVGVRLAARGRPPGGGGALIVANHVSWLDIHLLHSLLPVRFVSKAEVRAWPLIGWLAERAGGTLFLERGKKSAARRMKTHMAEHLRAGDRLALFPEGTTSDGRVLLPFYPGLFQAAVETGAPVWPVLIRYCAADGNHCAAAAYHGEMSLFTSLRAVLRQPAIHADVRFLPAVAAAGLSRRELAARVEAIMRAAWAADGRDNAPGTDGHPPAARR